MKRALSSKNLPINPARGGIPAMEAIETAKRKPAKGALCGKQDKASMSVEPTSVSIKEIAREHNIPIRDQPKLARELYRLCEVDDYIPQELFRAVAQVLQTTEQIASQMK